MKRALFALLLVSSVARADDAAYRVGHGIAVSTGTSAPTRGATMTIFAAGGSSDTLQVCMKAAANTYAWRTVYTAP